MRSPFPLRVSVFLALSVVCVSALFAADVAAGARVRSAIEQTASAETGSQRTRAYASLLALLGDNASLSIDERLHGAWAAFLLAENDAERAPLLALAATLPDVRARMLIGSFREYPALRKQWTEADRTHSAMLLAGKPPRPDNGGKRPAREIFGLNPFDAPFTADGWTDPHHVVGRWRAGEITVDVIAYPSNNFLARLRLDSAESERRLLGHHTGNALRVVAPRIEGTIEGGAFTLRVDGRTHRLQRTPVGATRFSDRPPHARVLLDATTGLRHFRHANGKPGDWKVHPDGSVEIDPAKGSLFSRDAWEDHRLYLEFRHAYNSESVGPRRGNSGVYIFNSYELQLIDSFSLPPTETSEGSVYHIAVPRVTASAAPLEWQSLEVEFRAPRFDATGRKTENARLTAWLNGTMIHDNVEVPHPTGGSPAGGREQKDVPGPQGFMLQNHGGLLQFRHIWVAPATAPH